MIIIIFFLVVKVCCMMYCILCVLMDMHSAHTRKVLVCWMEKLIPFCMLVLLGGYGHFIHIEAAQMTSTIC